MVGTVVQFNERHKWCGCLGIITREKQFPNGDVRYMIGVPVPGQGTAYIFSMQLSHEFVIIGQAVFMSKEDVEE